MSAKARAKTKAPAVNPVKALVKLNIETEGLVEGMPRKLPPGTVKLKGKNGIIIQVEKLKKRLIPDQRSRMVSSMGCVSNPGGPGC